MRDASRSSRNGVRVAMGRCRRQVILHPAKRWRCPAKSCGPGAATLASIHAAPWWRGNGDNKGRSPGRARSKPSNHCAGKAGMSRLYLSNPCAFFTIHCTRCCGRSRRPAFPAPSVHRGSKRDCKTRTSRAAGTRAHACSRRIKVST